LYPTQKTVYILRTMCRDCGQAQYTWSDVRHECAFCGATLARGAPLSAVPVRLSLNQLTGEVYAFPLGHSASLRDDCPKDRPALVDLWTINGPEEGARP